MPEVIALSLMKLQGMFSHSFSLPLLFLLLPCLSLLFLAVYLLSFPFPCFLLPLSYFLSPLSPSLPLPILFLTLLSFSWPSFSFFFPSYLPLLAFSPLTFSSPSAVFSCSSPLLVSLIAVPVYDSLIMNELVAIVSCLQVTCTCSLP